jgi:hypothetical protein
VREGPNPEGEKGGETTRHSPTNPFAPVGWSPAAWWGCWGSSRCSSGDERLLGGLGRFSLPRRVEECHGDVAEVMAGDDRWDSPNDLLDNQTPAPSSTTPTPIDTTAAADLDV